MGSRRWPPVADPRQAPRKAVVLAAGRGTRMKSLTDDCPKPMLPLAGRPMLAHQMDRFASAGIERVCIVVGYRAEMIRQYFREHPPAGVEIDYALQPVPNGTGSAALLTREFVSESPFLLTFGDILVDPQAYEKLYELSPGSEIVLALATIDDPYRGGAVYVEGERVVRIVEKPPKGTSTTNFVSAGIYLFRPEIFNRLSELTPSVRGEYDLTDAIHATVRAGKIVRYFEVPGFWRDIGRPEDLGPATEFVRKS
ncbi:MAG: sugar phosphate nucleotidyltransferase [Bryobacterales bacterium]|nr:sugar phosphate nucleotidyltransferase [Bryobacterales bacterium]